MRNNDFSEKVIFFFFGLLSLFLKYMYRIRGILVHLRHERHRIIVL